MAAFGPDVRNAVASTIAALLRGSRLFLLSDTGRTLVVAPLPEISSPTPGVLEVPPFAREEVIASGEPMRYEIRQSTGLVLLSGYKGELRIDPPILIAGGMVYIDGITLTV